MRSWRAAAQGDLVLLLLSVTLMGIGLVAIASASVEYGDFHFGNPWHHTQRHAFYLIIGVVAGGVAYMCPTATLEKISPGLLFLAFAFLILVLMPGIGHEVNGAQRWLSLGLVTIQPSDRQAGPAALRRGLSGAAGGRRASTWSGLARLMACSRWWRFYCYLSPTSAPL